MSGTWIELDENGREVGVVSKRPERGIELAADGAEVTPSMRERIDAAKQSLSTRGGPAPQEKPAKK